MVFRVEKTKDYTVMSNHHLRNKALSLKAKGLLSLMLSLPDEWDYSVMGLAAICNDGRISVASGVQELIDTGYIIRRQQRDKNGKIGKMVYVVREIPGDAENGITKGFSPQAGFPQAVKPDAVNPQSENRPQLNTNQSSTKKLSTDPSISRTDWRTDFEEQFQSIKDQIDYAVFEHNHRIAGRGDNTPAYDIALVDELVEIMLEVCLCSEPEYWAGKKKYPTALFQHRIGKINHETVQEMMDSMKENPVDVKDIKAYLVSVLFNGPATFQNKLAADINYHFN